MAGIMSVELFSHNVPGLSRRPRLSLHLSALVFAVVEKT